MSNIGKPKDPKQRLEAMQMQKKLQNNSANAKKTPKSTPLSIINPNKLVCKREFLTPTPIEGKNRRLNVPLIGQDGIPYYSDPSHFMAGYITQQNVFIHSDGDLIIIINFVEPRFPSYSLISIFYDTSNAADNLVRFLKGQTPGQTPEQIISGYKIPADYDLIRMDIANNVLNSAYTGVDCSVEKKARPTQKKLLDKAKTRPNKYSAFLFDTQGKGPVRSINDIFNGDNINIERLKQLFVIESVTSTTLGGTRRRKTKRRPTKNRKTKRRKSNKSRRRR